LNITRRAPHEAAAQHNSRIRYRDQELVVEPPAYVYLINGDPVELPTLKLPGEFHAVVLKHFDISNPDYPGERISHHALDMLTPGGIAVMMTSTTPSKILRFDASCSILTTNYFCTI